MSKVWKSELIRSFCKIFVFIGGDYLQKVWMKKSKYFIQVLQKRFLPLELIRQKNILSDDLDNDHFLFVVHHLNAQQSALTCIFPKGFCIIALKRQKYNLSRGKKILFVWTYSPAVVWIESIKGIWQKVWIAVDREWHTH